MAKCHVENCEKEVSKAGYKLCYEHWQDERDGIITPCESCGKYKDNDYPLCLECHKKQKGDGKSNKNSGTGKTLSSTAIGKEVDLSSRKINQILAELGWVTKYTKGWIATPDGQSRGAIAREVRESGVPYVVWPHHILEDKALLRSIAAFKGETFEEDTPADKKSTEPGFREKFPCEYRAMDGHMVRSKAEMLIDNFLYMNKVIHAFERKLPIEEDAYCDFYLPDKKVYIEYWGIENDPKYDARKKIKQEIYKKHSFTLIELTDEHVRNLDDHLPRMLLKYGLRTEA